MTAINHEYFVSLEVAKLLKDSGFDWKCNGVFLSEDGTQYAFFKNDAACDNNNGKYTPYNISSPTLDVAQRWLREAKNCYVSVVADCDSSGVFYTVRIIYYDTDNNYHVTYVLEETGLERVKHRLIFNNYEEAQETGVKKALEIILEKGE